MSGPVARTGARILVDQLLIQGVDTIFTVPGESFLAVLNELHDHRDEVELVTCRMEAGAANMAEAHGKLTDRPGICMVTRGPGAAHAAVGVHTAAHDGTPMILFIGQVARSMRGRGAFQEVDFGEMFGGTAKWTVELDHPARIPELLARAFAAAVSGQPGPVVVSMPEDVLATEATVSDAAFAGAAQPAPPQSAIDAFRALLERAERPIIIAGGGSWKAEASRRLSEFARKQQIPVAAAFRSQDAFDNDDPHYVGDLGLGQNPALSARVRRADLVIAAGTRLEETVTRGYSLLSVPRPDAPLVHIHPDIGELGRVYQPALGINSDMTNFFVGACGLPSGLSGGRSEWLKAARADYEHFQDSPRPIGKVDLAAIVKMLREKLPDNAVVCNGAGNYTVWLHRFFRYRRPKTQLAPTSGAMGYGVPAAVAAKIVAPDRPAVSLNGDGCFMMCGQELATAVQYGVNPVFIVVNNGMLGTIRMHQERSYPGRVVATDLANPDFVALAHAYNVDAERVSATGEFAPALERALASDKAYLIEIRLDAEALTPAQSLSAIRAAARQDGAGDAR